MFDTKNEENKKRPPPLGGGPHGYGDPDDLRLRKAEKDVIIPKLIREEAQRRCQETVKGFLECAKNSGLLLPFKCQEQNKANNECLLSWAKNPEFVKEITDKYLERRSYYRRTGQPLEKYKRVKSSSSVC